MVAETGVLHGKTKRALDSVVLDDAVATQDTVTQLIAAVRRVRREVPGAAAVIAEGCSAHDYDDPGKPTIAWDDKAAHEELMSALVNDATTVVNALVGNAFDEDVAMKAEQALALLALIVGQDVEPAEGSDGTDGRWGIARKVAEDRVISVIDPDARHLHKTVSSRQDGYKAHIAVEPDTGLITAATLTKGAGADNEAVVATGLLDQDDCVREVLGDSAYGTGELRAELARRGHTAIIKPLRRRRAVEGGFTIDDFTVDEEAGMVTCPNGIVERIAAKPRYSFVRLVYSVCVADSVHRRECLQMGIVVNTTPKFAPLTATRALRNFSRRHRRTAAASSMGVVGQLLRTAGHGAAEQVADLGAVAVDRGHQDVGGTVAAELDDKFGEVGLDRRAVKPHGRAECIVGLC